MMKRGELTSQQLVTIIILIISFAVILILIFKLNLGQESDKEICHNSVVMNSKSKNPFISGALDCKTNYVCISGGGKCENFNPSNTIKIDINQGKEKVKNDIMKAVANEMSDCWWMFGEGKVDYVGFDLGNKITGNLACSLCSIIGFDEKIQNDEKLKEGINYEQFYNYLESTEKENGKNYLSYLYGVQTFEKVEEMIQINPQEQIDFKKQYYVLTAIGNLGALKSTANWFASGFDAFNNIWGLNKILGETTKFKGYGIIPVSIKEKSKINDLECSEFLIKA